MREFLKPFAAKFKHDLKSIRVIWNILYLLLYAFLCVWAALYHPEAIGTAIVTTGGIVATIFSGFVLSRTYERSKGIDIFTSETGVVQPSAPTTPQGDESNGEA